MNPTALTSTAPAAHRRGRRSIPDTLAPVDRLCGCSPNLLADFGGRFESGGQVYKIPRYIFVGPRGGDDPIRIGVFAGVHGDEPAGVHAAVEFLALLDAHPELAAGYCLFVYPVCNPTGFEDGTRGSRRGRDLNREFWNGSTEPEVVHLQEELRIHAFQGIVSLHTDDTSPGMYGFVRGRTLAKHLLRPALDAAAGFLPCNFDEVIDGFAARNGIIREGYPGVLGAPPQSRPRPFEIIFETPGAAPQYQQQKALLMAIRTVLVEYRKLMAYAPNL